jgi:KaiC/GvpD/RAD55 family RecA-like ATPase
VAIVGLRRIGKSSLLYHFAYHYRDLPDEVVVAWICMMRATRRSLGC